MRALLVVGVLVAALAAPAGAAAAAPVFGTPAATASWGTGIEFRQPVTISTPVARAELLVETPLSPGPHVTAVDVPQAGAVTLRHLLDTSGGELLPNTTLTARWRLVGTDGSTATGPSVTVRYEDTRFTWQTRTGSVVRVHWYQGGASFGDRALQIGQDAVAKASRLLGVTETQPVDFFVYADQQAFYEALGPGTRENVGGQAVAEIRTLFALITPSEINASWVGIVIPHELTHLVFDTAVRNPYHFPPRWLNEGLAVYLSQGYDAGDRADVAAAVKAGSLMPLPSLASQFPTTRDRFGLAYAESVAAVDYLVRQKGEAALVALIRSYAGGVTDDEAFRAAIGLDVAGFDAAWRASLGAGEPVAYGPVAAPDGPLPPGWQGAPGGTGPGGGVASQPPSADASGTVPGDPASPAPSAEEPIPGAAGDDGAGLLAALAGSVLLAVGIGLGLVLLAVRVQGGARGSRFTDPGSPGDDADGRRPR